MDHTNAYSILHPEPYIFFPHSLLGNKEKTRQACGPDRLQSVALPLEKDMVPIFRSERSNSN